MSLIQYRDLPLTGLLRLFNSIRQIYRKIITRFRDIYRNESWMSRISYVIGKTLNEVELCRLRSFRMRIWHMPEVKDILDTIEASAMHQCIA